MTLTLTHLILYVIPITVMFSLLLSTPLHHLLHHSGQNGLKGPGRFSLARTQLVFWNILVVWSYLFIWIFTGDRAITSSMLVLIAMANGTHLAAAMLDRRVNRSHDSVSGGLVPDILWDEGRISVSRVQFAVLTLLAGAIFVTSLLQSLTMPILDNELLGLIGISSGSYLGGKYLTTTRTLPDHNSATAGTRFVLQAMFLRDHVMSTFKPLVLLLPPVMLAYLAFELTPSVAAESKVRLFAGLINVAVPPQVRMILFVMFLSGLGGFVSAVSNRSSLKSLTSGQRFASYTAEAVGAAILGVIFYVLIRAGMLAPGATTSALNPLGIAVLSLGVGLFAPIVMRQLRSTVVELYGEEPELVQAIQHLEQRFEDALLEPRLDEFDGSVWVRLLDAGNSELPEELSESDERCFVARSGHHCHLQVHFEGRDSGDENSAGVHERLRIKTGNKVEKITFDTVLDSATLEVPSSRLSSTFAVESSSPVLDFNFVVPDIPGEHDVFVEISQKNRLLQTVPVKLRVTRESKPT